ncbi:hypothetical protein GYMLUDRAFT_34260 [Collybiopsis luxurians FD-317 M1]|nr:hypothetical protein GYMLUDRAFT_34260 [Collybiopsis luxurians FD-317 M1]
MTYHVHIFPPPQLNTTPSSGYWCAVFADGCVGFDLTGVEEHQACRPSLARARATVRLRLQKGLGFALMSSYLIEGELTGSLTVPPPFFIYQGPWTERLHYHDPLLNTYKHHKRTEFN